MKLIPTLTLCLGIIQVHAQRQIPIVPQDAFEVPAWINPAGFGSEDHFHLSILSKHAARLDGQRANVNLLQMGWTTAERQFGMGTRLISESSPLVRRTEWAMGINVRRQLTKNTRITFGVEGDISRYRYFFQPWEIYSGIEPSLAPQFMGELTSHIGAGLLLTGSRFSVGLSSLNLYQVTWQQDREWKPDHPHIYLNGYYQLKQFRNENWSCAIHALSLLSSYDNFINGHHRVGAQFNYVDQIGVELYMGTYQQQMIAGIQASFRFGQLAQLKAGFDGTPRSSLGKPFSLFNDVTFHLRASPDEVE